MWPAHRASIDRGVRQGSFPFHGISEVHPAPPRHAVPLQNSIRVQDGEGQVNSILASCVNEQVRRSRAPNEQGSLRPMVLMAPDSRPAGYPPPSLTHLAPLCRTRFSRTADTSARQRAAAFFPLSWCPTRRISRAHPRPRWPASPGPDHPCPSKTRPQDEHDKPGTRGCSCRSPSRVVCLVRAMRSYPHYMKDTCRDRERQ
jgi:hypothetical protein